MVWNHNTKGVYSCKNAYDFLQEVEEVGDQEKTWSWILEDEGSSFGSIFHVAGK